MAQKQWKQKLFLRSHIGEVLQRIRVVADPAGRSKIWRRPLSDLTVQPNCFVPDLNVPLIYCWRTMTDDSGSALFAPKFPTIWRVVSARLSCGFSSFFRLYATWLAYGLSAVHSCWQDPLRKLR